MVLLALLIKAEKSSVAFVVAAEYVIVEGTDVALVMATLSSVPERTTVFPEDTARLVMGVIGRAPLRDVTPSDMSIVAVVPAGTPGDWGVREMDMVSVPFPEMLLIAGVDESEVIRFV